MDPVVCGLLLRERTRHACPYKSHWKLAVPPNTQDETRRPWQFCYRVHLWGLGNGLETIQIFSIAAELHDSAFHHSRPHQAQYVASQSFVADL